MVSIANKTRNIAQFFSSFDGIAGGGGWVGRARGNRMLEMRIRAVSKKEKRKKRKKEKEEEEEEVSRERERDVAKGLVEIEGGRRKRELNSGPTNPAPPTSAPEEKGRV